MIRCLLEQATDSGVVATVSQEDVLHQAGVVNALENICELRAIARARCGPPSQPGACINLRKVASVGNVFNTRS